MATTKRLDALAIAWLMAGLAAAIAPHVNHLPLWVTASALALGLWRYTVARRGGRLAGVWLRGGLAITGFIAVFATYRTLNGLDAGTALLAMMMSLKLLETNSRRDAVLILFLCQFLLAVLFLYSQDMRLAIYAGFAFWLVTTALLQVSRLRKPGPAKEAFRSGAILIVQALPVMVVLFVLFPRVPGPLWGLPLGGSPATSGLSDSMSPGSISGVVKSDAVAFRVKFDDAMPARSKLYWRGPVFNTLAVRDGKPTWFNTPYRDRATSPGVERGSPVIYELQLEPHHRRWLFALDLPSRWPRPLRMDSSYHLNAPLPVTKLTAYRLESSIDGVASHPPQPQLDLHVPSTLFPRARQYAHEMRQDAAARYPGRSAQNADIVEQVLTRFRRAPYRYTLNPPPLGRQSVDEFFFDTQAGFCEHYAAAFASVMRLTGIPARVVTGYLGGEANPLAGHLTVRQSHAHAWTEAWLDDSWVRVDPTAAVAPERIEQDLTDILSAADGAPAFMMRADWLRTLRFRIDALNLKWNDWILGYDTDKQIEFLQWLGFESPDWQLMATGLAVLMVAVIGGLALLLAWQLRPAPRPPVVRSYLAFCRRLARRGVERLPHEGPVDFARRARQILPELSGPIDNVTSLYVRLRYEQCTGRDELPELRRAVASVG